MESEAPVCMEMDNCIGAKRLERFIGFHRGAEEQGPGDSGDHRGV